MVGWMRQKRYTHRWGTSRWLPATRAACCVLFLQLLVLPLHAAPSSSDPGAPVHIGDQTVFTIHTGLANIDADAAGSVDQGSSLDHSKHRRRRSRTNFLCGHAERSHFRRHGKRSQGSRQAPARPRRRASRKNPRSASPFSRDTKSPQTDACRRITRSSLGGRSDRSVDFRCCRATRPLSSPLRGT